MDEPLTHWPIVSRTIPVSRARCENNRSLVDSRERCARRRKDAAGESERSGLARATSTNLGDHRLAAKRPLEPSRCQPNRQGFATARAASCTPERGGQSLIQQIAFPYRGTRVTAPQDSDRGTLLVGRTERGRESERFSGQAGGGRGKLTLWRVGRG